MLIKPINYMNKENLEFLLNKINNYLQNNREFRTISWLYLVKLHPSFINDKDKKNEIISLFKDCSPENIILSDDKAIIEIEMLYEPKILVGSLTSLSRYAEAFGSEFIKVDLY